MRTPVHLYFFPMRVRSAFIVLGLLCALIPQPGTFAASVTAWERSFEAPVDGLSIRMGGSAPQAVSAWDGGRWTPWEELHLENEQDPALTESNMVLFPRPVHKIRFQSFISAADIHPIRVSRAPVIYQTAAVGTLNHRILSRTEWGADESLGITTKETTKPDAVSDSEPSTAPQAEQVSGRVQDCNDMYAKYPAEFKSSAPVTQNAKGEKLRWPLQYSPQVRLLVVHHTALTVTGDARPPVERMRALHHYHATNRGWGDVGYHYLIDENGQIYEGRAGGDAVVGGHAYCNNVGTVGVAMMGNFDREQPPQAQVQSLQWLLRLLEEKYRIDPARNVIFHGKTLPPVVAHRELLSTDCPGLAMWSALDQVRTHVRTGDVDAPVTFPRLNLEPIPGVPSMIPEEAKVEPEKIVTGKDGLATMGQTVIEGRPGGEVIVPVYFRATTKAYSRNTRIARVTRSKDVKVWQEENGEYVPVRGDLRIPVPLVKKGESVLLRVKVGLPMERGTAALRIGSLNYTFEMAGRSVRGRQLLSPSGNMPQLTENAVTRTTVAAARPSTRSVSSSSSLSSVSSVSSVPSAPSTPSSSHPTIRVLLTSEVPLGSVGLSTPDTRGLTLTAGSNVMNEPKLGLTINGTQCETWSGNASVRQPVLRAESPGGVVRVEGYFKTPRQLRGIIECRVIDGQLVLINELPMEDYLAGLAEEPDTEPYEKQRAFAVAARTYATHYLDPANRKFPGKPYDGADSPATFQSYKGYDFELKNPQWVRAAKGTAGQVLTYKDSIIKPPYFSTDTGRTRTPEEAGWKNFPFAEIFSSKDDPWCAGMKLWGHGVGMSGCGALGQAREGKTAEQILEYYYPGTTLSK